jgi:hypothetical protein
MEYVFMRLFGDFLDWMGYWLAGCMHYFKWYFVHCSFHFQGPFFSVDISVKLFGVAAAASPLESILA